MSTITRITGTAIAAVLAIGAVAGCSSNATPEPAETAPVSTASPAPAETTAPEPAETAAPEPVADEFSAVVDGVLYQGSEKAPVRIGEDTPGQAPALDAQVADAISAQGEWETGLNLVVSSGKYVVSIGPHYNSANTFEGYTWYVIATNPYGNVKVLEQGAVFGSADEAAAQVFTLDGRALDRAEYVVIVDAR
jgi:hypothetical protein